MKKGDKIFVAGHRGLVGSAVVRRLEVQGFENLVTRSRRELDLGNEAAVDHFFAGEKPAVVVLAAAKVGGIKANSEQPVEFMLDNLRLQNNVISSAHRHGVAKLLFLGSSCIYPKFAPQPIPESALLTGPLEPTNDAYALAKIAGIKLCQAYAAQYGETFLSAMPTNLYGPNDNFDLGTFARPARFAAQGARGETRRCRRVGGLGIGSAATRVSPCGRPRGGLPFPAAELRVARDCERRLWR